jgi:SAM-dependent methyltransferase
MKPLLKKHTFYDDIPASWFKDVKSILEIGAADGWNQINSIHAEVFRNARYLGLDSVEQQEPYLNILKTDIQSFDTAERFDVVLLCHVIEHIPYQSWKRLFRKFRSWLKPNGRLIISCPYDEQYDGINHSVDWSPHVVFNITPQLLKEFMPNMRYYLQGKGLPIVFREKGEGIVKPFLRLILRALRGSNLFYRFIPCARQIIAVQCWR